MLDPADFSVIETLRNGTRIEIRAQRPRDRTDLEAALVRMSDESLYRRFFGAKRHFSKAISPTEWNGGFCADSGPSGGGPCRLAFRPFETVAVRFATDRPRPLACVHARPFGRAV